MPWNEPGENNKDPWGQRGQQNNNQGPPNLDEVLKKFQKFLNELTGKKSNNPFDSKNNKPKKGWLGLFILFIAVFIYLYQAIYVVNEKERAIILRFGKYLETVGPGLHIYFPPIDTRLQTMVTGYRIYKVDQEMLTQDENIVHITLSVQYNISNIKDYELNVIHPILSLEEASQSALRHVVGSSSMHDVLTEGRENLAIELKQRLQQYLDKYVTGLAVSRINIETARPPEQVQASFDDVIRAREDEEKLKNHAYAYANQTLPEARGEAKKIVEQAKAYKAEVVSLAEGQTARFANILTSYEKAPQIIREQLYLTTMQSIYSTSTKIFIDNPKAGNIFYLPLDKLMKETLPKEQASASPEKKNEDHLSPKEQSIMTEQIMQKNNKYNTNRRYRERN